MKNKKVCILLICVMAVGVACKKSDLNLQSQAAYSYNTYFTTTDALNQATIATYAVLLHQGLWSRDYYFIFDLLGFDAKKTTNLQADYVQLGNYSFGTNQPQLGQLWGSLYRMIARSNVVIDRANAWNPTSPTDQAKVKQYVGEVKFLRAYAYFNIVNLWGDAPLVTSYDSIVKNNYPSRAPAASLWAQVEQDLKDAEGSLPATYASSDLGRITSGAASALLGKAYLYEKKWTDAQAELSKVVQSGNYNLAPIYDSLFSSNNQNTPENVFQIMNQGWTDWGIGNQYYMFGGQETWGAKATHSGRAQEYGFNDWNNVYVTTAAVKAFTYPNPVTSATYIDPRAASTFYSDKAAGGDTVYCQQCAGGKLSFPFDPTDQQGDYKWKKYEYYNLVKNLNGPQSGINAQVIRYADVLLMLAEAYIQQGNTGSQPLALINQVRQRAGAILYTSLGSQADAMNILMRERQLELTGEQSRYFDLIRWGIAKQTLNAEMSAEPGFNLQPFQDKNVLLPIPDIEKNYNPNVAAQVKNDWN